LINLLVLIVTFAVVVGVSGWILSSLSSNYSRAVLKDFHSLSKQEIYNNFEVMIETLDTTGNTLLFSNWTLENNSLQLEHFLVGNLESNYSAIFFFEESISSFLYIAEQEILTSNDSGPLLFYQINPNCNLLDLSCSFQAPSPTVKAVNFNAQSQPWLISAPSDVINLAYSYLILGSDNLGLTAFIGGYDYQSTTPRFILGIDQSYNVIDALLFDMKTNFLMSEPNINSLDLFITDLNGELLGISVNDSSYFQKERINATSSSIESVAIVSQAYFNNPSIKEIFIKGYEAYADAITVGNLQIIIFAVFEPSDLILTYQLTFGLLIPLTFLIGFIVLFWSLWYLIGKLTHSLKHASDLMLEIANLSNTFNKAREMPHFELIETQSLLTAMETIDVALRSFVKYVPKEVVRLLIKEASEVVIGVDDSFLTIFFSDIESFTTISELLEPSDLVQVMSEYLQGMSEIILESGGVVDKYIGDAIMAFWNAPLPVPCHRAVACAVALRCQRELHKLNDGWSLRGIPPIKSRIGLNAGMALVGNLGSPERMSYTCIGDSVNLASRLEGLNKAYGTYIMISDHIIQSPTVSENFLCRPLDYVCVKGKTQAIMVYELICETNMATPDMKEQLEIYKEGFELFQKRKFSEASKKFTKYLKLNEGDMPATLLRNRSKG